MFTARAGNYCNNGCFAECASSSELSLYWSNQTIQSCRDEPVYMRSRRD